MNGAPRLRVREIRLYERGIPLRMPFRFGAATLTETREVVARVRVQLDDGREGWGAAAELLAAKWFDKNPALSHEQNYEQLRTSLRLARALYLEDDAPDTAFGLFASQHATQTERCAAADLNPLIAAYGPALLDRAVLDALLRVLGLSFDVGMVRNVAGVRDTDFAPIETGFDLDGFLGACRSSEAIHVRHTVGLVDPITEDDLPAADRVEDGLPETLEEVIATYGNRYFKLKVSGEIDADVARLMAIASVLDRIADRYHVSLDGNEQFQSVDDVMALWARMTATPQLTRLCDAVMYIEQPIMRATALDTDVRALARKRPVIIDESDADFDAFPGARALGYTGVSSKTCKGIYRAIVNAARCAAWTRATGTTYFLSGEDLTTQPGVGVQQDLALVSFLGLEHVERNAHHYMRGMTNVSQQEQRAFLTAHPDLYEERGDGTYLRVRDGRCRIGSLRCTGFAAAAEPDWSALAEMP